MRAATFGFNRTASVGGGGWGGPSDSLLAETGDGILLEDGTSYLLGNGLGAATKVSALSSAAVGASANEFPLVQSGSTVKGTLSQLKTLAGTAASADFTYVASNVQSGVDPAVTKPTGTASGDLLVYAISVTNGTPVAAGPEGAGWTILYRFDMASTDYVGLAYKIAGGSEAASYTWSTSAGGTSIAAAVSCFRGVTTIYDYCLTRASTGYMPSVLSTTGGLVLNVAHSSQSALAYTSNDADMTQAAVQSAGTSAVSIFYRTAVRNGGSGGALANYTSADKTYRLATGVSFV